MSIRSCKPCSVVDNYLSMLVHTARNSFLVCRFPYQILGFSLVGFTSVPLNSFLLTPSLWHFMDRDRIYRSKLRCCSAVTDSSVPSVIFSASTITTCITASASMDFPLILTYQQLSRSNVMQLFGGLSLIAKVFFRTCLPFLRAQLSCLYARHVFQVP